MKVGNKTRAVLLIGLMTGIGACERIPGTDAYKIKIAKEVAARDLIDPSSAQFRDLAVHGDTVCGEINAKNRMGAYVGFKRFFTDTETKNVLIDPVFDSNDLLQADDLCASVRLNPYSSGSLLQSTCGRAAEQRLAQISQEIFDMSWRSQCEGKSALPSRNGGNEAVTKTDSNSAEEDGADPDANMSMDANMSFDADEPPSSVPVDAPLVDADGNPVPQEQPEPAVDSLPRATPATTVAPSAPLDAPPVSVVDPLVPRSSGR